MRGSFYELTRTNRHSDKGYHIYLPGHYWTNQKGTRKSKTLLHYWIRWAIRDQQQILCWKKQFLDFWQTLKMASWQIIEVHWNVDISRQVKGQKRVTKICWLMYLTKCIQEYSVKNMLASLVLRKLQVVIPSFEIGTLWGAIGWIEYCIFSEAYKKL